jgi:ribonuclease Z
MIRYGTGFAVDVVFFTHFHADHYWDHRLPSHAGMMGREEKLVLYGPASRRSGS